ncbi:MAG: HAD family hydrolase [Nitrospiraceae bacterium]|nr:MAG: HAD family hydrolase [Nitrospiraceae bacterium]
MLKLLIFDLDGTLADTGRDITDALNYALSPYGVRTYSIEETKAMVGSGISKLLASLVPVKDEATKKLVTDRFISYYTEHVVDYTDVYPHVKETLAQLNGYKKAVVSNKREALSKEVLRGTGILQHFDVVWGSDSVRAMKPSPIPLLDLMDRFQVLPEETVIVGDSNYDVDAGKAAGIKTIAVTYGFRSRDVLKDADFIIDRFDHVLNVLHQINETIT